MSREFGEYIGGYFWDKIRNATDDAKNGRAKITLLWGEFLGEFEDIAYSIASCEACDSGEYDPIINSINRMNALKKKLNDIEEYLRPYKDCMEEAVRIKSEKQCDL